MLERSFTVIRREKTSVKGVSHYANSEANPSVPLDAHSIASRNFRLGYLILFLTPIILGFFPFLVPVCVKGQSSAASATVKRYINAVQNGDRKVIIDLSSREQESVSSIKEHNPQILWAKELKRFYDIKAAASLDPSAETVAQFLSPESQWRITEVRVDKNNRQSSIRVYVSANYPKFDDSPFVDTVFLKKSVLEFDLSSNPSLIQNVTHLAEGDSNWGNIPLMILNARWFADGLSGTHLYLFAVGGKSPLKWSTQCGSTDLSQDFSEVDGFGRPLNPNHRELMIESGRRLADHRFPLSCSATVRDAEGNLDTVKLSIPTLDTGLLNNYCWARAPWSHHGQGLPSLRVGNCIGKVIDFEIVKDSNQAQEAASNPARKDVSSLTETMQFIQDALKDNGQLTYLTESSQNNSEVTTRINTNGEYYEVAADPNACTLHLASKYNVHLDILSKNETVSSEDDHSEFVSTLPFKEVETIKVESMQDFQNRRNANLGHPEITSKMTPPIFLIEISASSPVFSIHVSQTEGIHAPKVTDQFVKEFQFLLRDENAANNIAKSIRQVVEICGGSNHAPF